MRYADLKLNDIANSITGVVVSLWMQGCPFRCKGCHNPQTWDFNGGKEIAEDDLTDKILSSLNTNGVERGFAVLGGEPLCKENAEYVAKICKKVRETHSNIKIYIWTGYKFEDVYYGVCDNSAATDAIMYADYVIEGPFIESLRDIRLKLRGSTNQRVFAKENSYADFRDISKEIDN